jgi:hypothetical protein
MTVFLLLLLCFAEAAFSSAAVGLAGFALYRQLDLRPTRAGMLTRFALYFLFWDWIWYPMMSQLDISVVIGHKPIAQILDAEGLTPLADLFGFDFFSLIYCFLMALWAYFWGSILMPQKTRSSDAEHDDATDRASPDR